MEVVSQYQHLSTFTSFNTSQGGGNECRHGSPACDLMLNEVIFTSSTEEDQVAEAGTNVELEDKSMNGTYVNRLNLLLTFDLRFWSLKLA